MPDDIDPQLPFIQLHRSVLQRASVLAPSLGMSTAQAIGCMVLFWMELSDRRLLAKHIPNGKVVLEGPELARRLRMSFGHAVDVEDFIVAGLIEREGNALGDGVGTWFRIRGMSRQLETEAKRLKIKRTLKNRVQPPPEPQVEPQVELDIGERREARGEASKSIEPSAPEKPLEEAFTTVPPDRRKNDVWRQLINNLVADYLQLRKEKYAFQQGRDNASLKRLMEISSPEIIRARWQRGLVLDDWRRVSNLGQLLSRWNDLADNAPPVLRGKPSEPEKPTQKPLINYTHFKGRIYANPDYPEPEDGRPDAAPGDGGSTKAEGGATGGPGAQGLKIVK